jgi:hypothetical protein
MLRATEFSVGCLGDAVGLTLILPRGRYDCTALVTHAPGAATAVFIEGEFRFFTFDCTGNKDWKGILIPNVAIQVDETSAEEDSRTLGSLIRRETQLLIRTKTERGIGAGETPLLAGLTESHPGMSASFTRWCIVLGEGLAMREVKTIDVSPPGKT